MAGGGRNQRGDADADRARAVITLTLSQLIALAAFATLAGIGAYTVGSATVRGLVAAYERVLEKLSSQRRWHDAYRTAVADLATECMAHRTTKSVAKAEIDQLRADVRALRLQVAGRTPDVGGEPALMRERFMRDLDAGNAGLAEETKDP